MPLTRPRKKDNMLAALICPKTTESVYVAIEDAKKCKRDKLCYRRRDIRQLPETIVQ